MTEISQPDATLNILGATVPVGNTAQRCLITAQMGAAGSATAGNLYSDVQQTDISALFKLGTQIDNEFDAFRAINPITPIDVIPLDDPTGDPAVGTVLWAGAATEAGSYEMVIGDERRGKATITVASGDADTAVATAVAAAYATLTRCVCAVTVDGVTTEQNNLTCNNDGTEGNFIPLKLTGEVAGLTFVLTEMAAGTGVPVLTNVFDVVGQTRYQEVPLPGTFGTSELITFLDARWNVNNRVQDGTGYVTVSDSKANHLIALALLNSQAIDYQCAKQEIATDTYKGPEVTETLSGRSCMVAAIKALRLTFGADISAYVDAAGGPLDATGGPHAGSLPYFSTPLPIPVMPDTFGWTDLEVAELDAAGGYVIGNNTAGNSMLIGEVVTTYKTDNSGNPDPSFKYQNYVDTASQAREYMFNNIKSDCKQSRLTVGDLVPGHRINNENSIRGKFLRYFNILSGPGFVLTVAGEAARNFFIKNLTITLNPTTGLVTGSMKLPIVTQLRTIIVPIQIAFNVNG